ncbi:MAG: MjaI family restriction endonuclease [Bacillota bacterium]
MEEPLNGESVEHHLDSGRGESILPAGLIDDSPVVCLGTAGVFLTRQRLKNGKGLSNRANLSGTTIPRSDDIKERCRVKRNSALLTEESEGIDGYIGDPVSIKPQTYTSKAELPEHINAKFIFYKKAKSGIEVDYGEIM